MIAKSIEEMLLKKQTGFLIPADRVATLQATNPLTHAFMLLTKVRYSKIPVLDTASHLTGLLTMPMITESMLGLEELSFDPIAEMTVQDVMQTDFDTIKVTDDMDLTLHLLVDNPFLPVVDEKNIFQGILTRREMMKAFNYVAHNIEQEYEVVAKEATEKN
ncbi:cyclic-di-AMP-binding protein CbpB [Lapidilactobacillus gannanensis]|jgi:predicted transcriptional regulator|uniref:Cyclic-di-AMP-binding protein CbpB n=1 Tax=Lapidilactobacillus gannanensis TaxID=2486002 RepID=A0ABW4BPE8_9LACO|nr:cyclic-di-AMP-binding protein CbpB [Lapidilactobacillus gannanensis]MCH4056497.1 CBS domain-containing protein [Lactobacillaceae bacterium]